MQNSREWLLWCRVSNQALAKRRGCCDQESTPGQALQGEQGDLSTQSRADLCEEQRTSDHANRETPEYRRAESFLLLERRKGMHISKTRQQALTGLQKDEVYLNLVLEFVPETVYRASRYFNKMKTTMPILEVKLYIYQLFRSLAYIHSQGICHRDIKPQNLLLDPGSGVLKLCDFGSAKILIEAEPNVSYICSRYYRAPELIFGATNYTTKIGTYSLSRWKHPCANIDAQTCGRQGASWLN